MKTEKEIASHEKRSADFTITLALRSSEGFESVYNKYFGRLFSISYSILRDQEKAENIVHDVFLSLWERRNKLEIQGSIEGYLVRAIKLAVMEYVRNLAIRKKHLEIVAAKPTIHENQVELELHRNELQHRINGLVNSLSPQSQKVYRLSREEGKNNKEISSLLSIAEKTVESHLTKALSLLRSQLSDYNL